MTTVAKIMLRKLDDLQPDPENVRQHEPDQIEQIAASIERFGWTSPMLVDDVIRAGNGRAAAARLIYQRGETIYLAPGRERGGGPLPDGTVPIIDCTGWTPEERTAYAIADNKLTDNSSFDLVRLGEQMAGLVAGNFDIGVIGFNSNELDQLLPAPPTEADPDEIPPVSDNPVSQLGDIWLLGDHRIACGSCTDAKVVAALLGEDKPILMVTDPPYGVEYDANWRNEAGRALDGSTQRLKSGKATKPLGARATGKVMNDDQADWSEAWALFRGDVAYVWHAGNKAHIVAESLIGAGLEIRSQIIWAKNQLVIGRGDYHPQHEPCWYVVRKGKTGHYDGGRKQTTVWAIDKPRTSETGHSTQKPVECMKRPIENNSKRGDAVYEPFSGSGTTIVAAEMTGRRCLAIELNPVYVDMAVRRWERLTGRVAQLQGGGTFVETAEERGVDLPDEAPAPPPMGTVDDGLVVIPLASEPAEA